MTSFSCSKAASPFKCARERNAGPGEMFVVPKGVEHCPLAEEETHILLIEPTGTANTGNVETAAVRTVA
jgi:mannose-6-phosphate isomerase-like protein (cupin superfamily)